MQATNLNQGWTNQGLFSVKLSRLASGKLPQINGWHLTSVDGLPILTKDSIGGASKWTILSKTINDQKYFAFRDFCGNLLHDGDGQKKKRDKGSTYCSLNVEINANFLWRFVHTNGQTDIIESDSNDRLSAHKYYNHDNYKGGLRIISHSDPSKRGLWIIKQID